MSGRPQAKGVSMRTFTTLSFLPFLALSLPARAQTALIGIDGTVANQQLGNSVVEIGDVNGDGIGDLAIGAPGDATSGYFAGAVYICSGANGAVLATALGPHPNGQMGLMIAAVGDVDGDTIPDVGVTALTAEPAGHVLIYSGATGLLVRDWTGLAGYLSGLGTLGDLDGDGLADVFIGTPDSGAQFNGSVSILSGATGAVLHTFTGPLAGEHFGASVSRIEDTNGDGVPDLLATSAGSGAVAARVISGATGLQLYAISTPAGWGHPTSGAGNIDVDGDGRGDLALGYPFANSAKGGVRFHSGATGALIGTLAPCDSIEIGGSLTALGDVDGDGHADFATNELDGHRWRVVSATGATLWDLPRWELTAVARTGDHNGDGRADVLLGLGLESSSQIQCGRVEIAIDGLRAGTGTPLTFGDGSGAACPCGNVAVGQVGCMNSLGVGASLRALGPPSVQNRSLDAVSTDIPVQHLAVLFRGTTNVNGGLGTALGDGLRGVGGSLVRLSTKTPCVNPYIWRPASVFGAWTAGQAYFLQVWYRDLAGPCGSGINLTNAVGVTMLP